MTGEIQRATFDYNALDAEAQVIVKNRTAEIHSLIRVTAQTVLKIGCKLTEVKPLLAGHFVDWLQKEFSWSQRTANNFMSAYKTFGAESGMKQQNYVCAFTERTRAEGRNLETQDELAYALTDASKGGNPHSGKIAGDFGVRRLTPRECERLQGYEDDWTRYGDDGKEISDSARYRMLGNAICLPTVEWIARRIIKLEEENQ